jgi:hypothetical protein
MNKYARIASLSALLSLLILLLPLSVGRQPHPDRHRDWAA